MKRFLVGLLFVIILVLGAVTLCVIQPDPLSTTLNVQSRILVADTIERTFFSPEAILVVAISFVGVFGLSRRRKQS